MPYFVWIDYNGEGQPQKWEWDHTVGGKLHPDLRAVNKHEITPRQWKHTALNKLIELFPFVPIKDSS